MSKNKHIDTPIISKTLNQPTSSKIKKIQKHFTSIMETLGLDITDDSLKNTPKRVAEMFVDELFGGLLKENEPSNSTFINKYKYDEMLIEKNIVLYSTCEHHFLPIVGKVHIAYISTGEVIGLSKINRIVNFYAKRPQVQERLTIQITRHLQTVLNTKNVACIIDAKHLCINSRGIKDINTSTVTSEFGGDFKAKEVKNEFMAYINLNTFQSI